MPAGLTSCNRKMPQAFVKACRLRNKKNAAAAPVMTPVETPKVAEFGQTTQPRFYHIPGFETCARKGEVIGGAAAGTLLGYFSRGVSTSGNCVSLGAVIATSAAVMGMLFAFFHIGTQETEQKCIQSYAMDALLIEARKRKGGRRRP